MYGSIDYFLGFYTDLYIYIYTYTVYTQCIYCMHIYAYTSYRCVSSRCITYYCDGDGITIISCLLWMNVAVQRSLTALITWWNVKVQCVHGGNSCQLMNSCRDGTPIPEETHERLFHQQSLGFSTMGMTGDDFAASGLDLEGFFCVSGCCRCSCAFCWSVEAAEAAETAWCFQEPADPGCAKAK